MEFAGLYTLMDGSGTDTLRGVSSNDRFQGRNGRGTLRGHKGRGHKGDDLLIGCARKASCESHKTQGDSFMRDFASGLDRMEIGQGATCSEQRDITQIGNSLFRSKHPYT